jgi:hypothetical protein
MANFDKQIKKQGESFSLEPRKEVWQRLETELDKTKRRRFAGWLWIVPVSLLAGAGFFYYNFSLNKTKKIIPDSATISSPEGTTKAKQSTITNQALPIDQAVTAKNSNISLNKANVTSEATATTKTAPIKNSKLAKKQVIVFNDLAVKKNKGKEVTDHKKIAADEQIIASGNHSENKKESNANDRTLNNDPSKKKAVVSEKIVSSGVKPLAELPVNSANNSVANSNVVSEKNISDVAEKTVVQKEKSVSGAKDLPMRA